MSSIIVGATIGAVTWSLLEYLIHRWLGHAVWLRPNPFASEHVRHHSEGNYFAPTSKKVLTVGAVILLLWYPAITVLGSAVGISFVIGFTGMYVTYEVVHRRDHTHPGIGAYARFLRRHHFHHHYEDPSTNHGVTSPIWDWVFGTFRRAGRIRVPRKLAPPWLVDPDTGELRPLHTDHYEIYGRA